MEKLEFGHFSTFHKKEEVGVRIVREHEFIAAVQAGCAVKAVGHFRVGLLKGFQGVVQ